MDVNESLQMAQHYIDKGFRDLISATLVSVLPNSFLSIYNPFRNKTYKNALFISIEKLLEGRDSKYATGDEVQMGDVFLAAQIYAGLTLFQIDMLISYSAKASRSIH